MHSHPFGSMHGRPGPGRGWNLFALWRDVRIAWRLIWDPSVPALLKICIPFLAFLYFLWPLDLMPGLPFDDIAIMLLATRLFVRLAPQDRVHKAYPDGEDRSSYYDSRNHSHGPFDGPFHGNNGYHKNYSGKNHSGKNHPGDDGDVIDTTWRVIDDK